MAVAASVTNALKVQDFDVKVPEKEKEAAKPAAVEKAKPPKAKEDVAQPGPKKKFKKGAAPKTKANVQKKKKAPEVQGVKITHISNKDQPEEPMRLGRASPELVHKLSWALPGALPKEMIRKMERFGYDAEAPAKKNDGSASSFIEKGDAEVAELSVYKRVHEVSKAELQDAKHAIKMFVLGKARQFGDAQKLEEGAKIIGAVGKLLARAETHMMNEGTLVVRD